MSENNMLCVNEESPSIQAHLSMLQNVIQRMAINSSSCKSWCITLSSAILVLTIDKDKSNLIWVTLVPIISFALLDSYYLALEKSFRATYDDFIQKLHSRKLQPSDLYAIKPRGKMSNHQFSAMKSLSVWGLYVPLALLVIIGKFIIIGA